ncbi:MAG: DNA polymerase III subunit delta' [Bacteroidia bacterium]|nr:DNA polymerase III subunit delta' [Bacteroidia bacterium]
MPFQDLVGQPAAIRTLQETVAHNRLPHALLLTGPAGIGKLALAQALAQYVNCSAPRDGDSCGTCSNCVKIQKAIHPDVRYILPIVSRTEGGKRYLTDDYFDSFRQRFTADPYLTFGQWQQIQGGEGKQLMISVHEIRELKRSIYLKAFEAPYKVVIIWNVEKINTEGANAFLKLLEEPPDQTLFIMTCSDASLLLPTINSRCQRLAMRRIPRGDIQAYLAGKRGVAPEQAEELAAVSAGSLGYALEYLDERADAMSALYVDWLRTSYTGSYDKMSDLTDRIYQESREFQKLFLLTGMRKMRDSLLMQLAPPLALVTQAEREFQEKFSKVVTPGKVEAVVQEMEDCLRYISGNANPQLVFTAMSLRVHQILRS